MYQEPVAIVLAVEEMGDTLSVTLSIDGVIHPPLVPSSLHPVTGSDQVLIELHRVVDQADSIIIFHSYSRGVDAPRPTIGETYVFRRWWSPDQLALAQDINRSWKRQTFVATDAVETVLTDGNRLLRPFVANENTKGSDSVIPTGWNHEHCAFCWQRISALEGDESIGYLSEGEWICETCYRRYIKSGFGRKIGDQIPI